LKRAQEVRQVADYTGESVDLALGSWVVEQSGLFIKEMRTALRIDSPKS
jgi:hypothetical protein